MGDELPTSSDRGRLGPRGRRVLTVVLGALFVVCFLLFTAGVVVKRDLLDPQLYIQVLAENNVYDRVYTEVLADPALQERFKARIGRELDLVMEELYAQVVAAGAMIVPPDTLQAGTEAVIERVVGYVRGDTPELDGTVRSRLLGDPVALARSMAGGLAAAAAAQLADGSAVGEKDASALDEPALRDYVRDLAEGRLRALPESVGRASVAGLSAEERSGLADTLLVHAAAGANDPTRLQIEASLASDDLPSALAAASAATLRPRLVGAARALLEREAPGGALDGLAAAATALGSERGELMAGLNSVRGYAGLVQRALVPLAVLLGLLLAAIVWLNRRDLRAMLASGGWTLAVAAGLGLLLWLALGWWLGTTVTARLAAGTGMTPGLEHVLGDVLGGLYGAVFRSLWALMLLWLLAGLVALSAAYSARLGAALRRLLAPVWPYRAWVLAGLFGVVVIVPLLGRVVTARQRAANPPCNGHPALCARPVNEVVFATTHNAMSITDYGWLWPMHDGTVTDQLEAGVRGLLLDTHYVGDEAADQAFLATLSPDERAVAEKAMAGARPDALVGELLCHQNCKMGATQLADTLEEIRAFLAAHPREVVIVVFQDEITAEDTALAVRSHDLTRYIYTHTDDNPWPTLGEMIATDKRLIIMAENEGPPPDWYTNAWDVTEETPYTFVFKEDFSCAPNRGGTGKPFFLLNHWIQRGAPNRADATVVNEYEFLLGRARQCAIERGKVPNFVAVNFYRQGDLFRVVDTLNGVAGGDGAPRPVDD